MNTLIVLCLTLSPALGEVFPLAQVNDWPVSGVQKVALHMNGGWYAGGYDLKVKVCHGAFSCCQFNFGEMNANEHKEQYVQLGDCHLQFNRQQLPVVQVISTSSDQFKPRFVDVWTTNGAMFQGRFNDAWVSRTSEKKSSIVFGVPTEVSNNVQLQQVTCPQPYEPTCPKSSMSIDGVVGQHNYICDFPCANGVSSFDPYSTGKGFRCFQTTSPQEKLKYCCLDGARGDIPACNSPVNYRNGPRDEFQIPPKDMESNSLIPQIQPRPQIPANEGGPPSNEPVYEDE